MAVPSPSSLAKPALRQAMRARRRQLVDALTSEQREAAEQALAAALEPWLAAARIVAGYHPLHSEISPLHGLQRAQAMGRTVAYPWFAGRDQHMVFRAGPPTDSGPWAFMQPSGNSPEVIPDLVLVPLVAIDRQGHRVGQGKGHYDRALPRLRSAGARVVGVGWPLQLVEQSIDHEPWDVPLDAFASPDGVIALPA